MSVDETRGEFFLAAMSHELRSPLHAIVGLAELLELDADLPLSATKHVRSIRRESAALSHLIDDLLDFSKVSVGELELLDEPFSPAQCVDGVVDALQAKALERGLDLHADIDAGAPRALRGDGHRIRQVLVNLASNAVKYTESGSVRVTLRTVGRKVRYEVVDTGPGIPERAQASLFDPYKQARREDTIKGTGLGLAISHRLVALMGGELEFDTSPGGTTFWFEIPLVEADPALVRNSGTAEGPDERSGVVLVVDDSPVNRMLSEAQLGRLGYDAVLVPSGFAALEHLAAHQVDAVLMDWHMPEMDGLETTRRIREAEADGHRTPIIAVTASAMSGDRERCLDAGMDDYLAKPISIETLSASLQTWIGDHDRPEDDSPDSAAADTDPQAIDTLIDDLGDAGVVASVLGTFLSELPGWVADIEDGVDEADMDTVRRTAHTIKSTATMFGRHGLAHACANLERVDADELDPALARFLDEAAAAHRSLGDTHRSLAA